MKLSSIGIPLAIVLLVAGVFFAGCSDNSTTTSQTTASPAATTTVAAAGPLYSAGDIVKNPKSTANTGLLIIGYDAATDMYERAYIYPNKDGSWGYRLDSTTVKVSRATIEKVYTEKVKTVVVSAVPIGTPTTAATVAVTQTTKTTTVATTETTAALSGPRVSDIEPGSGKTGTTVTITELDGQYFRDGANVSLKKSGAATIAATDIDVVSSVLIKCKFVIPSGAATGYYSAVVTNPDGQSYEFKNAFDIIQGDTVATTATTSATGSTSSIVTLYSASPSVVTTGGGTGFQNIVVTGTNLTSGANMELVSSTLTLTGTGYYLPNTQQAQASFSFPAGSTGTYTISIVDSSGTVLGSITNGFVIQ